MAVFLVRKRQENATIDISDDIRALKYGSFNNGVLKDYLQECAYEIRGNTFIVKSGEIFIDAEQLDIDGNGKEIEIINIAGINYYSIYAEIDLTDFNNQKGDIKATYSSIDYPSIDKGDNLTLINNGVARLELYRFEANDGKISNVQKMFDFTTNSIVPNAKNAEIAQLAEDSKNINGLSLIKDSNGRLKLGNIVIPQKKEFQIVGNGNIIQNYKAFLLTDEDWKISSKFVFSISQSNGPSMEIVLHPHNLGYYMLNGITQFDQNFGQSDYIMLLKTMRNYDDKYVYITAYRWGIRPGVSNSFEVYTGLQLNKVFQIID